MTATPTARRTLARTEVDTPLGPLTLLASDRGLRLVIWPGDPMGQVEWVAEDDVVDDDTHPVLVETTRQFREYFAGERTAFDLPLDLVGTDFQCDVWRALATIPYGQTRSYREQAESIGRPSATRAVGAANGRNPLSIVLPCHRVIGADGSLTGFGGGLEAKRWLLDHERASREPALPFG